MKNENIAKMFKWLIFGLVILVAFNTLNPIVLVNAGQRGVVLQLGKVSRTMDEGLNFRTPFIENVAVMDVRTQKHEAQAASASKDLQTINAKVAVNYSLNPSLVGDIYKSIGRDYEIKLLDPTVQESIKAATAQFTAEELITKREDVRNLIENNVKTKLATRGIVVEAVNIVSFDFTAAFDRAIEAKVIAEQDALAQKNKLAQVKYEADQRVAQAEGEAKAIKIQAEAVQSAGGADYVQLQAIKQWKGDVPQYVMGNSAVPFINLNK